MYIDTTSTNFSLLIGILNKTLDELDEMSKATYRAQRRKITATCKLKMAPKILKRIIDKLEDI